MELVKKSQIIKKNVDTIHIGQPLGLLERKLFNVLLVNSYNDLQKKEKFTISVPVLSELLGFDSKNVNALKDALKTLSSTSIEWSVFGDNKKEKQWGVTSFISLGIIENGECEYEYSSFLREKLYKPKIYANINLALQRKFKSKYALILYENCVRFRPNKKFQGITGEWTLDQFRQLMGVTDKKAYQDFKLLNLRVLKPAIKEICQYSDIIITPQFVKQGKKIIAIRFDVKENPQLSFDFDVEIQEEHPIVEKYTKYGIPELLATQWLEEKGEEYLQEKLNYIQNQIKAGKVKKSIGGLLVRAVQQDYKEVDPRSERRRIEKERQELRLEQRRKQYERQEAKKKLEQDKFDRNKKIENAVDDFFKNMPKDQQAKIEQELEEQGKLNEFNSKEKHPSFYRAVLNIHVRENYFDEESFVKTLDG